MFKKNLVIILYIIILQLIAAAIFYFGYLHLSIRLDESQSIWQTSHTIKDLLNSLAQNVHTPLYHVSFHYWQGFFGNSIFIGRLYSLIFFIASIPLMYLTGKKLFDTNTGLIATTLLALSPFMSWYASEIRMYTLIVFLTILAHYLFQRLMQKPVTSLWVSYISIATIGMYTHYFFSLVLFSHAVFFFLFSRKNKFFRTQLIGFVFSALTVGLLFLPWILKVSSSDESLGSQPLLVAPSSIDFFNVFSQFLFGFQSDPVNSIILSAWPVVLILLLLALQKHNRLSDETLFFLTALSIPLAAALVISISVTPVFLSRYLIVSLPAFYIVTTRLLINLPPSARNIVYTLLLCGMLGFTSLQSISSTNPVKENFEELSVYLEAEVTGRDIIIVSAPFLVYPIYYYYDGPARIYTLPLWNRFNGESLPPFDEQTLPEQVTTVTKNHDRLFLVLGYDQGYEETIKTHLDNRYPIQEEWVFSKRLTIRVYKTKFGENPEPLPLLNQRDLSRR